MTTRRKSFALAFACLLFVAAGACGNQREIGNKKLLEFEEQKDASRLGEGQSPSPATPGPQSSSSEGPPKTTPQTSPPPAPEKFFDVFMVEKSPFFEAQGPGLPRQPAQQFVVPVGYTLRVTNEDRTPERPTRSFTAEDGSFDSRQFPPGSKPWTRKFSAPGKWRIVDSEAGFIFANLEVK